MEMRDRQGGLWWSRTLVVLALGAASLVACTVPNPPPPSTTTTSTAPPPTPAAPYDFDHDGAADLVYANTTTTEYYRWGDPTVIGVFPGYPVSGDYDGDGVWELAGASGDTWTTAGARGTFTFPRPTGAASHVLVVPGRYDADGKTKAAWYRDSDATWFIEGRDPIQFGVPDDGVAPESQDIPVPGDYNGDGVDELAVYRPRESTFYVLGAATGVHVGNVGDLPVQADWDGDGDTDPATYDGGGIWHIAGQPDRQYGDASGRDFPAPADHDGVGGVEPAVWNADTDVWKISTRPSPIALPAPTPQHDQFAPVELVFNDTLLMLRQATLRQCAFAGTC